MWREKRGPFTTKTGAAAAAASSSVYPVSNEVEPCLVLKLLLLPPSQPEHENKT